MPDNNFNPLSYIMAALSSIEKYKERKDSMKLCCELGQEAAQSNKNVAEIIELCEKEDENGK